jgi:hypothetical protein
MPLSVFHLGVKARHFTYTTFRFRLKTISWQVGCPGDKSRETSEKVISNAITRYDNLPVGRVISKLEMDGTPRGWADIEPCPAIWEAALNPRTKLVAAFSVLLLSAAFQRVNGQVTITPTYDNSITSLQNSAEIEASIQTDINTLESDITTNAPVDVFIDFQNENQGLGGNSSPTMDIPYATYLSDLEANPEKSTNDVTALASMPAANVGIHNDAPVELTAANLAAVGDTADSNSLVSGNGGFDGVVYLNLSIINDTRPDANPNDYDLQSVAMHEMDEVLGIGGYGSTLYQPGDSPPALPSDVGPLDLFRYSSVNTRSFTYNPRTTAYFSINSGTTNLVYFNQQNGADGADFGDWGNPQGTEEGNNPPQVQDAFGSPGDMPNLGPNELTSFDVVGYNLTPAGDMIDGIAVPEPASQYSLILGGLGIIAFHFRRRATETNEKSAKIGVSYPPA